MKRTQLTMGLLGLMIVASCTTQTETLEEKARRIHESVITIDTHDDINVANFTDSINYTQRLNTQVNLPKMDEGQHDVAWLIVYTGQGDLTEEGYASAEMSAMSKFDAIHRLVEEYAPDQIGLATSSDEVRSLIAEGKKVAMIGVENAYPIGEDLGNFELYRDKGARYVSLSHNGHSQFSDSNTGEADGFLHEGLSELGKEAIVEMNRLGMMIDVSHPSKEAMRQMIALSKAPIIASHSSARALCDHSRNLDDEQQLNWVKENGGVIQTTALGAFLTDRKDPAPSMDDFMDHIDYMVDKIGIDHVGISSDFDGGGGIVGWKDASETMNVTAALRARGYSDSEIEKLWGGNLLRVLDGVQEIAAKMQAGEL